MAATDPAAIRMLLIPRSHALYHDSRADFLQSLILKVNHLFQLSLGDDPRIFSVEILFRNNLPSAGGKDEGSVFERLLPIRTAGLRLVMAVPLFNTDDILLVK